ncbi:MAG: GNAT family N-acetyltransferase [Chlamydiae bacterium]|nr:MAG: GNAT family N-acetyltransferase [Chlamydiota bacterium]
MLDKFQSKIALSEQIEQNFLYYSIKINNRYIGYFSVLPKEKELFLSKLYIKSSERGKGFGKKTIDFIENFAKEKNLYKITLTVNKNNVNSINAYKKMGFVNTGSVVKDIGNGFVMDDYKMEKILLKR